MGLDAVPARKPSPAVPGDPVGDPVGGPVGLSVAAGYGEKLGA